MTRDIILSHRETVVAAFYVAGAIPSTSDCMPEASDRDPSNTERFVTYNEGQRGDEVFQSPLGFVDPENFANRGCASQNGARCLAEGGRGHESILRFYYGEDIELNLLESCESDAGRIPSKTSEGGFACQHVQAARSSSLVSLLWVLAVAGLLRRRRSPAGKR
jgi:hypothetical protein